MNAILLITFATLCCFAIGGNSQSFQYSPPGWGPEGKRSDDGFGKDLHSAPNCGRLLKFFADIGVHPRFLLGLVNGLKYHEIDQHDVNTGDWNAQK